MVKMLQILKRMQQNVEDLKVSIEAEESMGSETEESEPTVQLSTQLDSITENMKRVYVDVTKDSDKVENPMESISIGVIDWDDTPSVCQNVSMDWFSYFAMLVHSGSIMNRILRQEKMVRLRKPPAKPPDVGWIHDSMSEVPRSYYMKFEWFSGFENVMESSGRNDMSLEKSCSDISGELNIWVAKYFLAVFSVFTELLDVVFVYNKTNIFMYKDECSQLVVTISFDEAAKAFSLESEMTNVTTLAYKSLCELVASAAKASRASSVAITLASSDGFTTGSKLMIASAIASGTVTFEATKLVNFCFRRAGEVGGIQILLASNSKGVKNMRKMVKICDTISEFASAILPGNGWLELLPFMVHCVNSDKNRLQESALMIFAQLAQYSGNTLIPYLEVMEVMRFTNLQCLNILESMGQSVLIFDSEYRINYWNKAAQRMYDHTKGETIGQNMVELILGVNDLFRALVIIDKVYIGEGWMEQFPIDNSWLQHAQHRHRLQNLSSANTLARIQKCLIRYLYLVVDLSKAASEAEFRPTRRAVMAKYVESFIRRFFGQNPLGHISLVTIKDGVAHKLTNLGGSPESHIKVSMSNLGCSGDVSLRNALDIVHGYLNHIPSHGQREILILYVTLRTCDPGDIQLLEGCVKLPAGLNKVRKSLSYGTLREILRNDREHFRKFHMPHVIAGDKFALRSDEEFARQMLDRMEPISISRPPVTLRNMYQHHEYGKYHNPLKHLKVNQVNSPLLTWQRKLSCTQDVPAEFSFDFKEKMYMTSFLTRLGVHFKIEAAQRKTIIVDFANHRLLTSCHGVPCGGLDADIIGRSYKWLFQRYQIFPTKCVDKPNLANQFLALVSQELRKNYSTVIPLMDQEVLLKEEKCTYYALYLRAWTVYEGEPDPKIKFVSRQLSSIIPQNYEESRFPVSDQTFTVTHSGNLAPDMTLLFTWVNSVGGVSEFLGDHYNRKIEVKNGVHGVLLHHKTIDGHPSVTFCITAQETPAGLPGFLFFSSPRPPEDQEKSMTLRTRSISRAEECYVLNIK